MAFHAGRDLARASVSISPAPAALFGCPYVGVTGVRRRLLNFRVSLAANEDGRSGGI